MKIFNVNFNIFKNHNQSGFTPTPDRQKAIGVSSANAQLGFTLMEIVVATTLFAVAVSAMLALFNYTLKINRRTEVLRQLTQGTRNFMENLVREVRNGKIDYSGSISECPASYASAKGYTDYLAVLGNDGVLQCFNWTGESSKNLFVYRSTLSGQQLNPVNFTVDSVKFYVRPTCDPFTTCYVGSTYPSIQPFVTIVMQVTVTLPSGETKTIPYQTTVSTDTYDVPRN